MSKSKGLANASEETKHRVASMGGQSSNNGHASKEKLSEAGKAGARAQSTQAKAKGGHNSHSN